MCINKKQKLVKAEVEVLKAKAKNTTADMRIGYDKEIEILEKNYANMQLKLHKLGQVGEEAWDHLKNDIENAWESLSAYAKKTSDDINEIKKDIK